MTAPNPQLELDLEASHTMEVPFAEWVRSLPETPWWRLPDTEKDDDD